MYGGDDTRIIVYNMERWLKRWGGGGGHQKNTKEKNP